MIAEKDQEPDLFARGLKIAMEIDGWKMKPLSLAAGKGETAIKDVLRYGSSPKVSTAYDIARAMGRTIDEIIALGAGDTAPKLLVRAGRDGTHALVDVWNISVSAGDGVLPPDYESVTERLAIPIGYLRSITTTSADYLQIISVKGRSMYPTLGEDDVVMIDRTKRHLGYDGIYVIRLDDTLHVKRVARSSAKGMVRIISDNAAESPEFERPLGEVEVLGRVIWAGKRM